MGVVVGWGVLNSLYILCGRGATLKKKGERRRGEEEEERREEEVVRGGVGGGGGKITRQCPLTPPTCEAKGQSVESIHPTSRGNSSHSTGTSRPHRAAGESEPDDFDAQTDEVVIDEPKHCRPCQDEEQSGSISCYFASK